MKTNERPSALVLLGLLALLPACGPSQSAAPAPEAPPPPPPAPVGSGSSKMPMAGSGNAAAQPGPKPWDPFDSHAGKLTPDLPTLRYYTLPG